jgi:hypothetical protein
MHAVQSTWVLKQYHIPNQSFGRVEGVRIAVVQTRQSLHAKRSGLSNITGLKLSQCGIYVTLRFISGHNRKRLEMVSNILLVVFIRFTCRLLLYGNLVHDGKKNSDYQLIVSSNF